GRGPARRGLPPGGVRRRQERRLHPELRLPFPLRSRAALQRQAAELLVSFGRAGGRRLLPVRRRLRGRRRLPLQHALPCSHHGRGRLTGGSRSSRSNTPAGASFGRTARPSTRSATGRARSSITTTSWASAIPASTASRQPSTTTPRK